MNAVSPAVMESGVMVVSEMDPTPPPPAPQKPTDLSHTLHWRRSRAEPPGSCSALCLLSRWGVEFPSIFPGLGRRTVPRRRPIRRAEPLAAAVWTWRMGRTMGGYKGFLQRAAYCWDDICRYTIKWPFPEFYLVTLLSQLRSSQRLSMITAAAWRNPAIIYKTCFPPNISMQSGCKLTKVEPVLLPHLLKP